ncbi:MAG TPA: succinyldiaminopimelate transaminase [Spongiibacteraceae bacterium]|nr:succinyldiaminopimelate transaminase [Spongiibacteraceae bacterium]
MNPDLEKLQPYPFEKLAALKAGITPPAQPHIALSIGEPKHPAPEFVLATLRDNLGQLSVYPNSKGLPELREAIAAWATQRFQLQQLDPETQVLPVAGTREALFSFAQAIVDRSQNPVVIAPNPFYQIYEGAAYLAGAQPYFVNCLAQNRFLPDFAAVPEDVWRRCQLLYICSPGNPTGAVLGADTLRQLLELADRYDFVIASDECYSEIYFDDAKPPLGLLQLCHQSGRDDYRRCVVFHSLSKRSNLPGLRSGFVAGDAALLKKYLLYRTYHGCALPIPTQLASIAAWNDEAHVRANRDLYRQKFDAVLQILSGRLDVAKPDAGFYLWAGTPTDDREFTRELFRCENITVLPGQFLARDANGSNPGERRVRMALVATLDECVTAAQRIARCLDSQ